MGQFFEPSGIVIGILVVTVGMLPGWIAGYRKAQHYLAIALLTLVGCGDVAAHGALVWAIALIWSCYDKPKNPNTPPE